LIDTERGSGELYSDMAAYDVGQIEPPFTPTKYADAIHSAEKAGYGIIIIDSLSHAWAGEGGVLDIHDKISKSTRNSFGAWREVTPQHNLLVDAMLGSTAHIIATVRSKTAYEIQSENNKPKVVKVGLAPVQREGLEYEFTLVLELSVEGHVASASKDRTGLFDGKYFTPSEETGQILSTWLKGDVAKDQESEAKPEPSFLLSMLSRNLDQLGLMKHMDGYLHYLHNKYQVFGIEMLSKEQLSEQLIVMKNCREKKGHLEQFIAHIQQLQQEALAA